MKKIFTIAEIADIVGQNKEKVRRLIKNSELKEYRPQDRKKDNSAKFYDKKVLDEIINNFKEKENEHINERSGVHKKKYENIEKTENDRDFIINMLKEQLDISIIEKKELLKLLDQQQKLTLVANEKVENLQIELKNTDKNNLNKSKKSFFNLFKNK